MTYDPNTQRPVILKIRNLTKEFLARGGAGKKIVHAVTDVSFDLYRGETLGLVGESGCGKTTLARTVLQLLPATSGSVHFHDRELVGLTRKQLRSVRQNMQIIFQDPYSSLHPKMTAGKIIEEPMLIAKTPADPAERQERVNSLLSVVGLRPDQSTRYPHEFSGGQRQRIVIARALALRSEIILYDEPVSALDVSVRAQILNLLEDLQEQFRLTYLFISHDLSVVEHICDRVAIMFLGKIVELGSTEEIFHNPLHPYTKALLSAVPRVGNQKKNERIILSGDVPSPVNPPEGCRFHTRCPYAQDICKTPPPMEETKPGHWVMCHRIDQTNP